MSSEVEKIQYDMRFRAFLRQIISVSRLKPKERYIYKVMDGVPFKDLETALLMAKIDYGEGKNDNEQRGL
jgi:hypothetical protein